ncbi:efflux RND transporter permease subunit, partial [Paraburkholderia sp. RL18-103-BIB-C]|uniref:efflux RND transporter permease subunit n=2 Tax=unclassified Paraburkholderia TaxID=2615204 RepID=UPI0038BA1118
ISRVPGAADVAAQQTTGQPYLRVIVKRDAVARYGLNASQVLDVVQSLGGRNVGTVVDGEGQFDIRVRLQPKDRDDVARISALRISNGDGRAVPLSEVADIRMEPGPSTIERQEGRRVTLVQANVRGRDLAGFVLAAQHAVQTQVKFPPGYTVSWGGSFKN